MGTLNRYALYTCSLYLLVFVLFEPLCVKRLTQSVVDRMSYGTAALIIVLPIWWAVVTYSELGLLGPLLSVNFFMCVVMWPFTCRLLDALVHAFCGLPIKAVSRLHTKND